MRAFQDQLGTCGGTDSAEEWARGYRSSRVLAAAESHDVRCITCRAYIGQVDEITLPLCSRCADIADAVSGIPG